MSVGAICFTSSGSNGGCWVVFVLPHLFFFLEKGVFFSIRNLWQKKSLRDLHKKNLSKEKANYAKKKLHDLRQKKK